MMRILFETPFRMLFVIFALCAGITGCDDPVSDDPDTACVRAGLYEYTLTMNAKGEYRYQEGKSVLQATNDGFFFKGGEEDRRELTVTCVDETYAMVDVMLRNRCANEFVTRATTTLEIFDDGSMLVAPYLIEWTCGTGTSTTARESWTLARP